MEFRPHTHSDHPITAPGHAPSRDGAVAPLDSQHRGTSTYSQSGHYNTKGACTWNHHRRTARVAPAVHKTLFLNSLTRPSRELTLECLKAEPRSRAAFPCCSMPGCRAFIVAKHGREKPMNTSDRPVLSPASQEEVDCRVNIHPQKDQEVFLHALAKCSSVPN